MQGRFDLHSHAAAALKRCATFMYSYSFLRRLHGGGARPSARPGRLSRRQHVGHAGREVAGDTLVAGLAALRRSTPAAVAAAVRRGAERLREPEALQDGTGHHWPMVALTRLPLTRPHTTGLYHPNGHVRQLSQTITEQTTSVHE